jgi:putative nucleotidyltransferase with HDIG domain
VRPIDRAYVRERLSTPALADLFSRMPRADQHHGITAARTLERRGHHDPDLITAALLHDVGKSRAPISVWGRVIVVLGEWLFPEHADRWGRGEAQGLRRPFVVRHRHAAWGAEMVDEAGASQTTTRLIRRHHEPLDGRAEDGDMLVALHDADDKR